MPSNSPCCWLLEVRVKCVGHLATVMVVGCFNEREREREREREKTKFEDEIDNIET